MISKYRKIFLILLIASFMLMMFSCCDKIGDQVIKISQDSVITTDEVVETQKNFFNDNENPKNRKETQEIIEKKVTDLGLTNVKFLSDNYYSKIDTFKLFMEASKSMKGYLGSGFLTRFQNIVTGHIANINDISGIKKFYTIAGKEPQINDNFAENLINNRIEWADSSSLWLCIGEVNRMTNKNTISLFFTDGILSGTNSEIDSSSPHYDFNINNMQSFVSAIESSLNNDKSCSIYLYKSNFNNQGYRDYFNYSNNKIGRHLKSYPNRPFYLIAFGDNEELIAFNNLVYKNEGIKPVEAVHFIDADFEIEYYVFTDYKPTNSKENRLKYYNQKLKLYPGKNPTEPYELIVGLWFKNLPDFLKEKNNDISRCEIEVKGFKETFPIEQITKEELENIHYNYDDKTSALDHKMRDDYDVFYRVRFASLVSGEDHQIKIKYKNIPDTAWVSKYSNMNDLDMTDTRVNTTTFGLVNFIKGFSMNYNEHKKDSVSIKIIKE